MLAVDRFKDATKCLGRSTIAGLLLILVGCRPPSAHSPPSASADIRYVAIARDINTEIQAGRLTGVAVALVHRGRIVWEQGFGWADQASHRKATAHTPFSLASTTKTFTTAVVMALVNAGLLDLDRPADDYLGPNKIRDDRGPAEAATVRTLATMSSGLPTFFLMYPEDESARPPSVDALLRIYGHVIAPPGTHYEYSNLGMAVLADIVARVSHQEFGDYLEQHLLAPLSMHDSFFDRDSSRRDFMATRYDDDGKPMPFYVTATPGSGEMYASAHDLALWAMFQLKDHTEGAAHVLPDRLLDTLHRAATRTGSDQFYGMGWEIWAPRDGQRVLFHGGGQSGVKVEFVLIPSEDVGCVVLSNRHTDQRFIERVRDRLIWTVIQDWRGIPVASDPTESLRSYPGFVGTWRGVLRTGRRAEVATLVLRSDGTGNLTLGQRAAQPVLGLGVVDGWLTGESTGDIQARDVQREQADNVETDLELRGGHLEGELVAWRKTGSRMAVLPFWIEFDRSAP